MINKSGVKINVNVNVVKLINVIKNLVRILVIVFENLEKSSSFISR